MPVSDDQQLLTALARGGAGFDEILGTAESEWIEFKSQPYRLETESDKFELAKDVTALANAVGGFIVIGVRTMKSAARSEDVADKITPIPIGMLDCDRIRQVIERYCYPPPRRLGCQAWPAEHDRGLLTIHVPAQPDHDKYFIVTEGILEDGRFTTNLIGLFIRDGATSSRMPSQQIQELLRLGRRRRLLDEHSPEFGLSLLKALGVGNEGDMARHVPGSSTSGLDVERVLDDARAAGIDEAPYLYLQSWQESGFEIEDFHSRGPGRFRTVFEQPPQLRTNGFNLDFGPTVELLPSGGLRRTRSGSESVSVFPGGRVTFVVGTYILGWAMERLGPGQMNSLALVESVSEFCRFAIDVVGAKSNTITTLTAGFRECNAEPRLRLRAGRPEDIRWRDDAELPLGSPVVSLPEIASGNAAEAAYRLLRQLYSHFGLPPEAIPYADADAKTIDFEQLKHV